MSRPRPAHRVRPDAMSEAERAALAAVYRFILDSHERKEGGRGTAPDARKESNGSGKPIIPRRL